MRSAMSTNGLLFQWDITPRLVYFKADIITAITSSHMTCSRHVTAKTVLFWRLSIFTLPNHWHYSLNITLIMTHLICFKFVKCIIHLYIHDGFHLNIQFSFMMQICQNILCSFNSTTSTCPWILNIFYVLCITVKYFWLSVVTVVVIIWWFESRSGEVYSI